MPEDMPDRMPDRMPENMSDRMPEDLPVTKCINVMVGITRSKVIWIYPIFLCNPWYFDASYVIIKPAPTLTLNPILGLAGL
jgi:hypothetical protein